MSLLFQPLKIRGVELKNRIGVSPMCQYSAMDGFANDWHLVHLGSRAAGGAGIVIVEATAVCPEGRISPGDLGLWKDEQIDFLKRIVTFIESQGAVPCIQLGHAGRKASHQVPWKGGKALTFEEGAWQTFAPSAIPYSDKEPSPKEMTLDDIRQCISNFSSATKRSMDAGFKAIEIHAAHGYLINEFLSPLSNQRNDEYGGSFENRIRLLLQIVEAARNIIGPTIPLFVRISVTDWVSSAWSIEDSIKLATILKAASVDLIDCSSGGNSPLQKIPVGPLYQVNFAAEIKKSTGLLTAAVGIITTPKEAEEIVNNKKADLVLLARQFLRDPYFPLHAAKESGNDIIWPKQYERAK
jgi:2,4-dienoyl-CoA reductase-like NADH-dependent reductase (Old Yellow Enzyme family)